MARARARCGTPAPAAAGAERCRGATAGSVKEAGWIRLLDLLIELEGKHNLLEKNKRPNECTRKKSFGDAPFVLPAVVRAKGTTNVEYLHPGAVGFKLNTVLIQTVS